VVQRLDFCVLVRHPQFQDYNAVYDLSTPGDVERAVRLARGGRNGGGPVTIYLSDAPEFAPAGEQLERLGYKPAFRTESLVAETPPRASAKREDALRVKLVAVDEATLPRWIELYASNFSTGASRAANENRWTRLFRSEVASHFFLIKKDGTASGTVQLISPGNGCCGVFSLSMLPRERGLNTLGQIYRELLRHAGGHGCRWLSFDRLRPAKRRKARAGRGSLLFQQLHWMVVSSETGYRELPSA
jgi:hypothetical protein